MCYGTEVSVSKEWDRQWVAERRERAVRYLGAQCVHCGTTDDLQFDHVDAATKAFNIGRNLNRRWEVVRTELDKCQLLCRSCHRRKSKERRDYGGGANRKAEIPHGTASGYSYWKCRCTKCWSARMEYRRNWAAKTSKPL